MSTPNPNMTIEERARFALDNPGVAHTPADLREIIAGLLDMKAMVYPHRNGGVLVRYCHECGSVGNPRLGTINCCPDGGHATHVHPEVADQARLGFLHLIEQEKSKERDTP